MSEAVSAPKLPPGALTSTVTFFALVGPLIGLFFVVSVSGAIHILTLTPPPPTLLSGMAATLFIVFAYVCGLPSALIAGIGVILAIKRGQALTWKISALIGLAIGIVYFGLVSLITAQIPYSWATIFANGVYLIGLHVVATLVCWRLTRRWHSPAP